MRRQTRKSIIEERIKKVLSLERELEKNRIAQGNLGYMELEKPIRDGWFRTFKLREDIARGKHAKISQEILDAVVVEVWGRSKRIIDKDWSSHFPKTYNYYQRPGVKFLNEKEYSKLSLKGTSINHVQDVIKIKNIFIPFIILKYFVVSHSFSYG